MSTTSQQVLIILGQRIGMFQVQEIRDATQLSETQVRRALEALVRRGYVERLGINQVKATTEGLSLLQNGKDITSGPKGPRMSEAQRTSLRHRLWKAMRLAKKASVSDLMELAARGSECGATQDAKAYLNVLVRSGHLMRLSRRAHSEWPITTGESRYCLVLDTGPQAPQYNRRQKRVFDPNTGETFQLA
jgi:DNA-binding MarR family transcriptional regulator